MTSRNKRPVGDLGPGEFRELGYRTVDLIADYYETIEDRPVYVQADPEDIGAAFDEPLPEDGEAPEAILDAVEEFVIPYATHNPSPRYFGFVEKDGEFLCAALVRAGLGRVFGFATELPDGTPEARYWAHLRRLEREARVEGLGGWGVREAARARDARPPFPEVAPGTYVLARAATVFAAEPPHARMGLLRGGSRVEVLEAASPVRVRIRFPLDGEVVEALLARADIEAAHAVETPADD